MQSEQIGVRGQRWMIAAFVVACGAAVLLHPMWERRAQGWGVLLACVAVGMSVWALRGVAALGVVVQVGAWVSVRWRVRARVMAVLAVGTLAVLVWMQFWQFVPAEWLQLGLWVVGVGLWLAALTDGAPRGRLRLDPDALPLLALMLFALGLRLFGLERFLRVLVDEMQTLAPIVDHWRGDVPLLQQIDPEFYPYAYFYPYLQHVGGMGLSPSLFTLRLPSALVGTLSVGGVYLLGRGLYGRGVGWLAACMLSVLPMHLQFSRLGILNIYDPLWGMLAFILAWRALTRADRAAWAWVGLGLGLTHYFYEGGRLLYTPLLMLWVAVVALGQVNWRAAVRGMGWALLSAAGVVAPLYLTWGLTGVPLLGRLASQAVSAPREQALTEVIWTERLWQSFLMYVSELDTWAFYGGTQPLVPMLAVPFFLLGIGATLSIVHRQRAGLLPSMWVGVTATAAGLLVWNPTHAARHTVAMPAMALLVALGVWVACRQMFISERLRQMVIFGAAGWLMFMQAGYYFGAHLDRYNEQARDIRGYIDPDDAILRLHALPPQTRGYIILRTADFPELHAHNLWAYLHSGNPPVPLTLLLMEWVNTRYMLPAAQTVPLAFFVEANNAPLLELLLATYPDVQLSFSTDARIPQRYQLALVYVPPNP